MSLHDAVSQRLAQALESRSFAITRSSLYRNKKGRVGLRLFGRIAGTRVLVSQSHTAAPLSIDLLKSVLAVPDRLDQSKTILYTADRRLGPGIRIEAWHRGRWYQVFIPILRGHSLPEFVVEILNMIKISN